MFFKLLISCVLVACLQKGCLAVLETLADKGDCQFYNELEAMKKCGTNGYLIGYGGKYCRKFGDNYNSFNEDGQHWINSVRMCLMSKVLPVHTKMTCKQLETYAFQTHVDCYLNAGYGAKSICEIWHGKNAVGLFTTLEIFDFFRSPTAILQVFVTGSQCLAKYGSDAMGFLVQAQQNLLESLGGLPIGK